MSGVPPKAAISRCLSACGYTRSRPAYSESQNAMQQVRVSEAVMLGCRRELLALRDFGIGICFDEIGSAVGGEAKVDAPISIELQCSVGALGNSLDTGARFRRKVLGRPIQNSDALLIIGVVFDLLGGDVPCTLGHVAEFQLPHRQHPQPLVAEHADIELASLDILLGDGGSADLLVDEGDALRQLLIRFDDGCLRDAL